MIKQITIAACVSFVPMITAQLDSTIPSRTQSTQIDVGSEAHPARVAGGLMAGTVLTKAVPRVPREALVNKPSGTMVIAVVIDPQGRVVRVDVISGAPSLRPSYLEAVRQWTYKPFYLNGQPVFVQTTVTLICDFGALD